ncbi:MAG: protein kinase [Thiohalomonadales bacterium]
MANEKSQTQENRVTSVIAIPGYKIIDILGRGGMAIVYKAIQESVGRTVAIKVLAPNHSDETFTDRFLREAQIISNLTHPNIITVFDAGVVKSYHYMSMEYITGKTLRDARDDLSRKQKVDILKQIALALNYAGNKGYVHRDIKPENIMLHEDGRAVLMDFGIARGDDTSNGLTLTGKAIGTPYYMSPEQTKGVKVDPRSDIYSLGVVLFQALTGYVPYDGNSFVDVGIKHLSKPIPTLPNGLESFQAIINKAMSKDPAHRYQSGAELVEALNNVSLSRLDSIDAKAVVISKKPTNYDAATLVEPKLQQPLKTLNKNKSRLKENTKSGLNVRSKTHYLRNSTSQEIKITSTDEFKALKKRSRLLYLILITSLAVAVYYNKKTLEPYWIKYALPVLHEYLPDELKLKIGLDKITLDAENIQKNEELINKKQKIVIVKAPETLFDLKSFTNIEQDNASEDSDSSKIISDSELQVLKENLNEQPQNANELILYYKQLLNNDINNSKAHKGITELRVWFLKQLKESLKNNDIVRGKLLLGILKENFPKIINKTQYQQMENHFLQKESMVTHLRLAEEYIDKEQFIEPVSSNALEELDAVLAFDPNNVKAKKLKRKMLDIYVGQVKNQQAAKHYKSAILYTESGLKISKNDAFLKSANKNLQHLLTSQKQVDGYLILAKKQMEKGNYVTPDNNNAFKIYRSVFELDSNNKEALAALEQIELKLVKQAVQAIKSNNISNAKLILQLLEQYYPGSKHLKKTQTSLAEAIDSKDPAVTKIVFSDFLLSSMDKMEDIRIQSGNVIYFGFKFRNFSKNSNYLQVKLLDHTAITNLKQKTIKIDGTKGEQIFSIEIPGAGLNPGNYYIELKHGKKSLIKKSFQIYEP